MNPIDICAQHANEAVANPSHPDQCTICQIIKQSEVRQRLLSALPHFRFAMREAAEKGQPMVGILSVEPNGSGSVEAKFNAPDFFNDLALVLGAPPQTKEDDMEAKAAKLAQQVKRGLVDIG